MLIVIWAILQFLIAAISFVIDCKELKLAPTTQIDQFYQFLNLICITCIWLHLLWVNSFANEQNNVKNEINMSFILLRKVTSQDYS